MLFDSGCAACSTRPGPVCGRCEGLLIDAPALVVPGIDVCVAAFELDDRAREIIAALKYRRHRRLAPWFAQRVAPLIPRSADALTWLPATPERRKQRGFDQAEELARSLTRSTQVPSLQLLTRTSTDQRQTGQTRAARLAGPELVPAAPSPSFVVIIDDVATTGSSLRVAAEALRSAGAKRLVGVTMAVTPLRETAVSKRCSVHEWM